MDTGHGKFEMMDSDSPSKRRSLEAQHPQHGGWFRVGETVEINGSLFRIKSIKPTELRLKLLKRGGK